MVIRDLLNSKQRLILKISELRGQLQRFPHSDDVANELVKSIDLLRETLICLDVVHHSVSLNVGGQKISMAAALIIKNTVKLKADALSDVINKSDCSPENVLGLMEQRDQLVEDYDLLVSGIEKLELSVEIS